MLKRNKNKPSQFEHLRRLVNTNFPADASLIVIYLDRKKDAGSAMKRLKKLIKWLRDGNDCEKCPCAWEEWGAEDYDGGCYAGRNLFEGTCRLPRLVRWYIARRAIFYKDHEYDGYGEWYEERYEKLLVVKEALYKRDQNLALCWKYQNEGGETVYRPYDQEMVCTEICYDIVGAIEDYRLENEPQKLCDRWTSLVKETIKRAVFKVREVLTI